MSREKTVKALLAGAGVAAGEQARHEARIAARIAWARERIAALQAAYKRLEQAWNRIFDALPDDFDDDALEAIPEPPEQAEVDAIHAELDAVREQDRWPRKLHWGDV